MNTSPDVIQAIVALQSRADWELVCGWIKHRQSQWNQVLVDSTDPDKRAVAAGGTRALNELLAVIEGAPKTLNELSNV
jgi:hypothetical protein